MQISANTTGMPAGITVATDKEGRDFSVVVVKGTFDIHDDISTEVTADRLRKIVRRIGPHARRRKSTKEPSFAIFGRRGISQEQGSQNGTALPNIDLSRNRIKSVTIALRRRVSKFSGVVGNHGFGIVGTYDDGWLRNQRPFLPADFDDQYFQFVPVDQQFEHFRGGERVRCSGKMPNGNPCFVNWIQESETTRLRSRKLANDNFSTRIQIRDR